MGLETYHIVLIIIVVVFIVVSTVAAIVKRRRRVKTNESDIRTVTTIQRVYYEPAKYTQYPPHQNTTTDTSAPEMPGWNLTNLDGPTSGVNIRHPESGFVLQRDPVTFPQAGYPPYPLHEANTAQPHRFEPPPPYNPNYPHSSN